MSKTLDKLYGELVEPYKCAVCKKCWRYLSGKSTGRCVHGGPYLGYIDVAEKIAEAVCLAALTGGSP